MFEGSDFPKVLEEQQFNEWLEKGRESKISYRFLLILWDAFEEKYQPVYLEERNKINSYERYGSTVSQESLVAAYDLYSESRIMVVDL